MNRKKPNVVPLRDLLDETPRNGYSPVCPELPTGKWVLGLSALNGRGLDLSAAKPAPEGDPLVDKFMLRPGDFLISRSNTVNRVGHVGVFRGGLENCSYPDLMMRFRPDIQKVDPHYLETYLRSDAVILFIRQHATGTSGSMKKISREIVELIPIVVPVVEEQEAIATVLLEWDAAIEGTEQLIAAKWLSVKELMRRLFREHAYPRRQLAAFSSPVTRKNTHGGGHPLTISGADGLVSQSRYFDKRIAAEKTDHYTLLKRGEFAYNRSYSAGYPLGAIKRLDTHDEGVVSTLYLCFALIEGEAPLSNYFAYFCESGGFNHQIYQVAQEGARNHGLLNVTAEDFFSMSMPVPPPDVQLRVVRVLDAAHEELRLLREQLVAVKMQKRGLMQKLLTGEWRLPLRQEEAV
ncbi:MAG: restriction endonuclease subunit S [Thermoanaerobaculia bacterium]